MVESEQSTVYPKGSVLTIEQMQPAGFDINKLVSFVQEESGMAVVSCFVTVAKRLGGKNSELAVGFRLEGTDDPFVFFIPKMNALDYKYTTSEGVFKCDFNSSGSSETLVIIGLVGECYEYLLANTTWQHLKEVPLTISR